MLSQLQLKLKFELSLAIQSLSLHPPSPLLWARMCLLDDPHPAACRHRPLPPLKINRKDYITDIQKILDYLTEQIVLLNILTNYIGSKNLEFYTRIQGVRRKTLRLDIEFEEDIEHILTVCLAYSDVRSRILAEMKNVCENSQSGINLDDLKQNAKLLTQFILDCCSLNLPRRFNVNDHDFHKIFQLSRDLCYFIRKTRTEKLKLLSE